jgi:hypothetical protein
MRNEVGVGKTGARLTTEGHGFTRDMPSNNNISPAMQPCVSSHEFKNRTSVAKAIPSANFYGTAKPVPFRPSLFSAI